MVAGNLLSLEIVPLRTSDTGQEALSIMSDFYVRDLPIVNNEQLLGLLSEDDILNNDVEEAVGSYQLSMNRPFVHENDHLFEVLRVLNEYNLTVVPVIDHEENYLGLISHEDLLKYFANTASFSDPGSIIVLEMSRRDYSLAQIARIAESENANIISSFITSHPSSTQIDVTIKVNHSEVHRIIAAYQRFDYQVKASFVESDYIDSLKERYDSLMAYLNV